MICKRLYVVLGLACLAAAPVPAQQADAPGPVGGAPAALPELRLPSVQELRAPLPRTAKAATALAGLGRQRLALVVGLGTIGHRVVVAPASRDAQAVATALRSGGFVVMRRDDVSGDALRAALADFRDRLQPEGVGFVYVAALGAQLDGINLLLPRDTPLAATPDGSPVALSPRQLQAHGVPLAEVVAALAGAPEGLRLLVVDAAYRHPALAALPQPGLTEQPLPPGVMALFGHGLQVARDMPATAPLPEPAPSDPAEIAATPFAAVLAGVLTTPRISGPQALLSTRSAIVAATQGRENPWLGGETDSDEELAEATLLDALLPRTPAEMVGEGVRHAGDPLRRRVVASAGERSVADVLAEPMASPDGAGAADSNAAGSSGTAPPALSEPPPASGVGATVGAAANAVGTAAAAVGVVAASGAAVAAVVTASEAAAVAGGAAGTAGAAVGQATSLISRAAGREVAATEAARPLAAVPAMAPVATGAGAAVVAAAATTTPARPGPGADPAAAPIPGLRGGTPAVDGRTVRRAEGGERPVWVPRRNAFGYAEGDTFSYQVVELGGDEVIGTYTHTVDAVLEDGRLAANGQQVQMDAQGRLRSQRHADGSVTEFVPVQDLWWSRPQAGERRDIDYTETWQRAGRPHGEVKRQGSSRVGTPRRIETPAGTFEVLPIESRGWYRETLASGDHSSGLWSRTVYYSTELGHPVAIDILDANRLGRPMRRERVELTHAQTSRGAP
ncbi:MAG: hypothetical protein U5L05_18215 [Rubrivivax sp.]|nr:hypothetical protein [Rubrivivax sp.]